MAFALSLNSSRIDGAIGHVGDAGASDFVCEEVSLARRPLALVFRFRSHSVKRFVVVVMVVVVIVAAVVVNEAVADEA